MYLPADHISSHTSGGILHSTSFSDHPHAASCHDSVSKQSITHARQVAGPLSYILLHNMFRIGSDYWRAHIDCSTNVNYNNRPNSVSSDRDCSSCDKHRISVDG